MTRERMQMSIQTVKDNIAILESLEPQDAGYYLQLEHEKFVLSALEKQIPKKLKVVNYDIGGNDYFCSCGEEIKGSFQYCPQCGQALDWSDSE